KAGVISLTKNLARQFAPYINVNAVAPGWINTDMNKDLDNNQKEEIKENTLLKRMGEPIEIAHTVVFLASQYADYITGEVIRVDGGEFK
ncbi:MAG TPA: SDR family oxidoreductase, partial [Bacilli bacterium]|nr:SDR family oxidoreductase [Bacilli bacterium]